MPDESINSDILALENNWKNSIGGQIGGMQREFIGAHFDGIKCYIAGIQEIFNLPSVSWQFKLSLIGTDAPILLGMDIPGMAFPNMDGYGMQDGKLNFTMDIRSKTHHEVDTQTDVSAGGSAHAEGGTPFFGKVGGESHFDSKLGVKSEDSRDTSYKSKAAIEINMGRIPATETCKRIMDTAAEFVEFGMDVNKDIVDAMKSELAAQAIAKAKAGELVTPEEAPDEPN